MFGDTTALLRVVADGVREIARLATAIDRLAAATEQANEREEA